MSNRFVNVRAIVCAAAVIAVAATIFFINISPQRAQSRKADGNLPDLYAVADDATRDIRNGSKELYRVRINSPGDREKTASLGRIVETVGPFVVIAADRGSIGTRTGLEPVRLETTVNLSSGTFDPVIDPPAGTVPAESLTAPAGDGYYVVQFGSMVSDGLLDSLREAGVEVLQYVPHQAYFVYGDGVSIARAARHSRVRWVGAYLPEQKASPVLAEKISAARSGRKPGGGMTPIARTADGRAIFDVAAFKRVDLEGLADKIAYEFGGRVIYQIELPGNYFNVVRAEVPLERAIGLLEIPGVVTIDTWQRPQPEDERAAQIVAGNYTSTTVISGPGYDPLTQFGADGTNVTISMVDDGVSIPGVGGFYITSANTANANLRGSTAGAGGGHGHLNASIISGTTPFGPLDPTGHNYGLGIAPMSNILNVPMLKSGYAASEATAFSDTVGTAGPNGVLGTISNNSWGNEVNSNVYDSYTSQFDGFVRDASIGGGIDPITLVFSAGNSGPGALSLTRPKAAKNLIATGNSENIRTELGSANANNMDDLRSSSSRGPTADGRIKPDITAPGTYITGGRAGTCGSVTSCFDTNHAYSIGTSHAAPQIAGAAALFANWWKNTHSGVHPSPSLIKAAIINTAVDMNGASTTAVVPNGNEGWGRINMKLMLNTGVAVRHIDESAPLNSPGDSLVLSGAIASDQKPFRVSLVWTDPPGAANANPALVNNLDLTVTVGANTYRGNVFSGGSSTTGGVADTINNVENVWLPAGITPGTQVTITVSATALNGDGILGNGDATDQHFSLVAYNFTDPEVTAAAPYDFDGDGKTDVSIFRPSVGEWWYLRSVDGGNRAFQFGNSADTIVPGDYTGDGKTDVAFWRPSSGEWFILRSNDGSYYSFPFGSTGDIPAPSDYDGDGITDAAVYRPTSSTWFILNSHDLSVTITTFGIATDKPVPADYDGDGKSDIAIFRPSLGEWWYLRSIDGGNRAFQFGGPADRPVQGDFTGDGKADLAFWRPTTGEWFVLRSENGSYFSFPFGLAGDIPSPGDYDGDGLIDATIFRPSSNTWFSNTATAGTIITTFGSTGDQPVPSAYVP